MIRPGEAKYVFVNGKGGVGKTSVAASLAVRWAASNRKCLLVSTDPAHNLGDLFDCDLAGNNIQKLAHNLDGLEIDTARETKDYINAVKERVKNVVDPELIQEANRHIDLAAQSPGAAEAAMLQRFVDIILDYGDSYDNMLFDTAPSGHTLRLLALPDIMSSWMEGMLTIRQSLQEVDQGSGSEEQDSVLQILKRRKQRLQQVHELLIDEKNAEFLLVTLPEQIPLAETKRVHNMLKEYRFSCRYLIVNKVIGDTESSDFLAGKKRVQSKALEAIDGALGKLYRIDLPYFPHEITGYDVLVKAGKYLEG